MDKQSNEKHRSDSPEQVTAEESLKRMKSFAGRKEKFVAAVKKSKN